MDNTSMIDRELKHLSAKTEDFLKGIDPTPFSAPAFSVLIGKITQYASDLVQESATAMKRDNADSISAKHVEIASKHLLLPVRKRIYKHLGTIGGLCLGTSFSTLCSMILANQFPQTGVWISVISGMMGAFLLALHMAKE